MSQIEADTGAPVSPDLASPGPSRSLEQLSRALGGMPHAWLVCDAAQRVRLATTEPASGGMWAALEVGQPAPDPPPGMASSQLALADGGTLRLVCAEAAQAWPRRLLALGVDLVNQAEEATHASGQAHRAMVAGVSRFTAHALGNPLAGLSLTLELLAGSHKAADHVRYIERCSRIADRLAAFKETLGALGGDLRFEPEAIDGARFLRDVVAAQNLGEAYAVSIEVDPECGPWVCYRELLATALRYLVRNAADASPNGGTLGLTLQPRPEAAGVRLTVWDDGPGLPVDLAPYAFNVPITTKAQGGGMGLLLAGMIVQDIHGGIAHYSARAPRGAAFYLDLPPLPAVSGRSADA